MKAMTLRLPDATHDRLRRQAFEQHTHINKLILDALEHTHDECPKAKP